MSLTAAAVDWQFVWIFTVQWLMPLDLYIEKGTSESLQQWFVITTDSVVPCLNVTLTFGQAVRRSNELRSVHTKVVCHHVCVYYLALFTKRKGRSK